MDKNAFDALFPLKVQSIILLLIEQKKLSFKEALFIPKKSLRNYNL
jgi:hypothetical protein